MRMMQLDEYVGRVVVKYYRQILPVFRMFKNRNINLGDGIYYGQKDEENVGDLVDETLGMVERTGGPHAFHAIKYMIPTYESCV